ncbi:hypothetical protein [Jatrophihabitans sp.]|uniref:hypothetical protein n=1 Tax=Jatrophihabitans sp. TaxID=1932789 RepID=UPI002C60615A|nr:hypothetical protein [Jatrophihabitans sp.]
MRIRIAVLLAGALALAGTLSLTTASQASTTHVDLSITGNTVAGYTTGGYDKELPVVFTMKNRSGTAVSVDFYFTFGNATAELSDYTCPLISNHALIDPDSPACEPGVLGARRSTSAAILVTPTISSGTVTVTACAQDEDGYPDPVPADNCKTVSIPVG